MARNHELSIEAPGLAKLRRDLKRIDADAAKELTSELREMAKDVRDDARGLAPFDEGDLKKSIKHSVRARGASVFSDSDYAEVHEWGGTIRPRGTPIEIRGRRYIYTAVGNHLDSIYVEVERSIERIADRNGFS